MGASLAALRDLEPGAAPVPRCYDPCCLSCSTHAVGQMPLHVRLLGPGGAVLDELRR